MNPLVEVRGLSSAYGGHVALQEVSFRLGEGERLAVVGSNGAGKSTLLAQLVGLLLPSAGSVWVDGRLVTPKNLPEVRRTLGLLLQDPDDQLFCPTVGEDVAFGPRNLGLAEGEVNRRVSAALERVGASHLAGRAPHRLSAGEKRRAALATVLALEPRAIALDEPSSHLDPRGRRRLIELLGGLDVAMVLVTHDLDLAVDLCPRVLVLHQGRLEADGPTLEILGDQALLERCELELPLSWRR